MGTDDNIQALLGRIEHKIDNVWGILAGSISLAASSFIYYGVDKYWDLGSIIASIAAVITWCVTLMFLSREFYRRSRQN